MHQGVKKKDKTPLLVKEVIFPQRQDSSGSSKNPCSKNDKGIRERRQETTGHEYKKADQHEQQVLSLMVIEEKPLENYFEGTRKRRKSRRRKKEQDSRPAILPKEIFSDGAQTLSEGEWKQPEEALTKEEKTEVQLLSLRLYEYEKRREEETRKNYVRQKKAEEDYICQLETLAKMWFKTGKRRQVTEKVDDDLILPKSLKKSEETSKKRTMKKKLKRNEEEIFSSPRERRNEKSVPPPGKSKKVSKELCRPSTTSAKQRGQVKHRQAQSTDSVLEDDFNKKLVLVDEDSDEFDYFDQSLQFRNSSM